MEPSRPFVDFGTQIQIQAEGVDERFRSQVLGLATGRFLLVRRPNAAPASLAESWFAAGSELAVRFVYDGTVWGFRTTVLQELSKPDALLFLEYPGNVERYELRGARRFETRLQATAHLGDNSFTGVITDLSESGACLVLQPDVGASETPPHPDIGSTMHVEYALSPKQTAVTSGGVVRSLRADGRRLVLGLEFVNLDPQTKRAVSQYVKAIEALLEPDQSGADVTAGGESRQSDSGLNEEDPHSTTDTDPAGGGQHS